MIDERLFDDNILSYLEKNVQTDHKNKCINYFGKWWTFEEVFEESKKVAKQLTKLGLKKGDRITVSMVNFPQALFLIFGASYLGLEMFMWDVRNNTQSFVKICERVHPKVIFYCDWDSRFVLRMCRKYKDTLFIQVGPIDCFSSAASAFRAFGFDFISWRWPIAKNRKKWSYLAKQDISDVKLPEPSKTHLMYFPTSGSTGQSKYVILSSKHFCYQLHEYNRYFINGKFKFREDDAFLNFLPVFACTGLDMIIAAMLVGMKQYIYPIPDIAKVWEQIITHKCSYVFGPTKFYEEMISFEFAKETKDLSFIRFLGCGGDKLPPEKEAMLNAFFNERGSSVKMSNGYGMTETTAPIAIQDGLDYHLGNVGPIWENTDIKIVDPKTGKFLKDGEIGEIWVNSLSKMIGYLKYDENGKEHIEKPGEYLHTGDLGYVKDNQLYVEGRMSRMVTMKNGSKFLSEEYENTIKNLDGIKETAVICDNSKGDNAEISLFVQFENENNVKSDYQKMIKFIKKSMNPFEFPTFVYLVKNFPMLPNTKKDYKKLEQLAKEGKLIKLR